MRDVDELNLEGPDLDHLPGLDPVQLDLVEHLVLFQAPLHQRQRERCAVDRNVDLRQQKRQRANVVLMPVRQQQRTNKLFVFF